MKAISKSFLQSCDWLKMKSNVFQNSLSSKLPYNFSKSILQLQSYLLIFFVKAEKLFLLLVIMLNTICVPLCVYLKKFLVATKKNPALQYRLHSIFWGFFGLDRVHVFIILTYKLNIYYWCLKKKIRNIYRKA